MPAPDPTPLFEPSNGLLAAVKPIWFVAIGAATLGLAVSRFDQRLQSVEKDIRVLTAIACADRPQDSLCRTTR